MIVALRQKGYKENEKIWICLAEELSRATRNAREVNCSALNRFAKENDTIVVPGKVLGTGIISKKMTIAAWSFSHQAIEKLLKAGCKLCSLQELMQKPAKGRRIRIMG